jgi:hypothetical protein
MQTNCGFIASKDFWIILLSNLSTLSVPNEDYSRNASCILNFEIHHQFVAVNNIINQRINDMEITSFYNK